MNEKIKEALEFDLAILIKIIEFHGQRPNADKEYIDAILDEINRIKKQLSKYKNDK